MLRNFMNSPRKQGNDADDGCETNGTSSGQWCENNTKYAEPTPSVYI